MNTNIKEYTYDKHTSWVGYSSHIRDNVKRELTEKDYQAIMKAYISGVSLDQCLEDME